MENKPKTATPDNTKASVEEDSALDYWSNEFGISKAELIKVVKAGGSSTEAVEKYVRKIEFAA